MRTRQGTMRIPETYRADGNVEVTANRICNLDELQYLTQEGWLLVALVSTDVILHLPQEKPPMEKEVETPYGGINVSARQYMTSAVATQTQCLLRKHEDVLLTELRARVQAAEKRVLDVNVEIGEANDRARTDAAQALKLEDECTRTAGALRDAQVEITALRTANRLLEADIAKIRNDVGAAKMREILGTR